MRLFCALLIAFSGSPQDLVAEAEVSLYGMSQSVQDSSVSGNDPLGAADFDLVVDWVATGASGLRFTYWRTEGLGIGLDLNNTGATANPSSLAESDIDDLALEDGTSIVTFNAYHRWDNAGSGVTPYVGAGVGIAMPQIRFDGGGMRTDERQITGPAMQIVAGARYTVAGNVSVFGEMQSAYSLNSADLNSGGGFDTTILANGVNFGIALGF